MSKHYGGIFDFDAKSNRLVEVNQILEDPKIWDDPKQAQALGKEKKALRGRCTHPYRTQSKYLEQYGADGIG